MSESISDKINNEIKSHKIVLFVKGTPQSPQCGFSASTMALFNKMNVPYHTVDILANPEIRVTLPEYSQWPTFPQVFIKGKLVGGADIVNEMFQSGELQKLLSLRGA